jgi:hypothetical protein
MGSSNFFRQALVDPGGMTLHALGVDKSPAVQRFASMMPGTDWGVTKELAPTAYNAQQAWMAKQRPQFTTGPYAGVTPTLADANSGYGEAAGNAVQNAQRMVGVTQPPRSTAQQAGQYGYGGWNG